LPAAKKLRSLGERREFAFKKLGIGPAALKRLEKEMHLAIADDLLVRLEPPAQRFLDSSQTSTLEQPSAVPVDPTS
jgi:hypothetical protein